MWHEADGSPRFGADDEGKAQLVRTFWTDYDQGEAEAATQGYTRGDILIHTESGTDYPLVLRTITVSSGGGRDTVTITWTSPSTRNRSSDFNDGVPREAGDQEWHLEFGTQELPAKHALDADGLLGGLLGDDGNPIYHTLWQVEEYDPVRNPTVYLVQRLWLDKSIYTGGGNLSQVRTLPQSKAEALNAARTYVPGGNGNYEPNAPKLMHWLKDNPDFLCVEIGLEEDAHLVCRTARFEWKNANWDANIYAEGNL